MKYRCPTCGCETEERYTSSSGLGIRQLEILRYLSGCEPKTVLNISTKLDQSTTVIHDRVTKLTTRGLLSREEADSSWGFRSLKYIYTTTDAGDKASRIKRAKTQKRGIGLGKKQKEVISYLNREGTETMANIASDLAYLKGTMIVRVNSLVAKDLVYKYSVGSEGDPAYVYKLSKRGVEVANKIRVERVRKIRGVA